LTVTLMSLGIPMIGMGDEVCRTQLGNNNAYCQDNEISWFDWNLIEKHSDVHRFLRLIIERRLLRGIEHERHRINLLTMLQTANKSWHGTQLFQPDWSDGSYSVALGAELKQDNLWFHWIMNAFWEPLTFELPKLDGGASWRRWIDTGLDSPDDILPWREAPIHTSDVYRAEARSVVFLFREG
jgi:isoamylase